jgi:arylsulfatase A-like enzyme
MDTVRADVFQSLLDSGKLNNIEAIKQNGVCYSKSKSNAPWTVPAHGSIFTGKYPSQHGITGNSPTYGSNPLVEDLIHKGYSTAAFCANPWLTPEFDFNIPFDRYLTHHELVPGQNEHMNIISHLDNQRWIDFIKGCITSLKSLNYTCGVNLLFFIYQYLIRADSGTAHIINQSCRWIDDVSDPFFLFINLFESHLPYEFPARYHPNEPTDMCLSPEMQNTMAYNSGFVNVNQSEFDLLKQYYRQSIIYLDAAIKPLLDQINKDNTAVIITSDHGEHFGEMNRFGHQYSLFDELLHVPLITMDPITNEDQINYQVETRQIYDYIRNISQNRSHILNDKEYTLAEYISPKPSYRNLKDTESAEPMAFTQKYKHGARSISKGQYKLIQYSNADHELIDMSVQDRVNMAEINNDTIKNMYQEIEYRLGSFINGSKNDELISDSTLDRLRSLGYK